MATIELNDQTVEELRKQAETLGVSVEDLVRLRVLGVEPSTGSSSDEPFDFQAELDRLSFNGPTLPADFSRADIYNDHD